MMKNTVTGFSWLPCGTAAFSGWAWISGLCRSGPFLHYPAGSKPSPGKPCQHTGYPGRKAAGRQMVRLSDTALFHTAVRPDYHDGRRFYICPILTKKPAVFTNGSPKWLKAFLFLALCICITSALNYGFIPPSSVRINLHNLRNGETYDTIFIGTSHGQYGIDPFSVDAASGGSSVSLCMADAYPDDMYHILRLACETQSPSRVVYELDPSYWMNEQRSGSTQIFFYQEFPASRSKFFFISWIKS